MSLSGSEEIRNKEYRHGLVNAQIEVDLPLQIRALRKQLVGTQSELSRLTGMKQARISDMEKPGKVHFSLETLRRLAEAFDVAFVVRFAPFSELLDWSGKFSPDTFQVRSFTEELRDASASAEEIAVADQHPMPSLAGLGLSPEHQAQWAELYRESANQSLRVYFGYHGSKQGSLKPVGYSDANLAGAIKRPIRPKGKLFEMPKRSEATHLQRRQNVRREQRTEQKPTRRTAS